MMKQTEISLQGLMDAAGNTIIVAYGAFLVFYLGYLTIFEANWYTSLLWQIPIGIAALAAVCGVCWGIIYLYEKNPTVKIGKNPDVIPKAKVIREDS